MLFLVVSCGVNKVPVEILYWANLNGNLENCGCGDNPLGGLDLAASVIREKRRNNPDLLFIDGGNFGNPYSFPSHNQRMELVYNQLSPDIITPGYQDFIDRPLGFTILGAGDKSRLLSSNYKLRKNAYISSLEKNNRGQKVKIYSVLAQSQFEQASDQIEKAHTDVFQKDYQIKSGDDLLIVVFQGWKSEMDDFRNRYPEVDCILWSFAQSDIIQTTEKPFVIGGRSDGEYLLDLRLNENYLRAEVISIDLNLLPDNHIRNLLDSTQILIKP